MITIQICIPAEVWDRYAELRAKRRSETLTENEQRELISISDRVENANARRVQALAQLAALRQVSLEQLMAQLGITAPGYE